MSSTDSKEVRRAELREEIELAYQEEEDAHRKWMALETELSELDDDFDK